MKANRSTPTTSGTVPVAAAPGPTAAPGATGGINPLLAVIDADADSMVRLNGVDLLRNTPPPHDPVLDGLCDRGAMIEIVAPSKLRKSFYLMQLLLGLTAGVNVLGFNMRRRFTAILADMELGADEIHRRLHQMGRRLNIQPKDIDDRLQILPLAGATNVQEIIEAEARGFDIVAVDPLYALCDGDEGIVDLRQPLRLLRRLAADRAACFYVHHDPKGAAGERDVRDRGSGSGITGRAVDARITLTPAKGDPDNTVVAGFLCRSYIAPKQSAWRFEDGVFVPSDLPPDVERGADRRARQNRRGVSRYVEPALRILDKAPMTPSLFKARLREDLGLSKNDADSLTAFITQPGGPAQRGATKSFPPERFIEIRQSSQSSREDLRED